MIRSGRICAAQLARHFAHAIRTGGSAMRYPDDDQLLPLKYLPRTDDSRERSF